MRSLSAWTVLLLGACALGDDLPLVPPPPPPPIPAPQTFRFEISPSGGDAVGLMLGATMQLAPRMIGSAGDTVPVSGQVSYSSSAPSVVSVNGSGGLTALTLGSSTLSASAGHNGEVVTDTVAVLVACTAELRSQVTPLNPRLAVGERFTPTLSLTTCGGHVTVTKTFTWSAMDPTIVSVDPHTGESLGLRAGTTVVRAQAQGYGYVAGIQIIVN